MRRRWIKWPLLVLPTLGFVGAGLYGFWTGAAWFDWDSYATRWGLLWAVWSGFVFWLFPNQGDPGQAIETDSPKPPDPPAPPDPLAVKALLEDYRKRLVTEARRLRIADIFPHGPLSSDGGEVPLDEVFVPMRVVLAGGDTAGRPGTRMPGHPADAPGTGGGEARETPRPIIATLEEQLARRERPVRLVLLGEAGAGKSSLVDHLILRCADPEPPSEWPEALRRRSVLRVNLRELGCRPGEPAGGEGAASARSAPPAPVPVPDCPPVTPAAFWRLVGKAIAGAGPPSAGDPGRGPLVAGALDSLQDRLKEHGLLLLDALDEVLNLEQRDRVRGLIQDLAATLGPGCVLLVTARPYAYRAAPLDGFRELRLQPFSAGVPDPADAPEPAAGEPGRSEVAQLVHRWYARYGSAEAAETLVRELRADPDLAEMAARPLLLTLLIAVALNRRLAGGAGSADAGALPGDRALVLDEATELFITRWKDRIGAREPSLTQAEQHWLEGLGRERLREVLQRVSRAAHKDRELRPADQDAEEARRLIVRRKAILDELDLAHRPPEGQRPPPRELERVLLERNNLLYPLGAVDDAESLYAYVHPLFQEYLAASALVREGLAGSDGRLAEALADGLHRDPESWREVVRLAAVCRASRGADLARGDAPKARGRRLREDDALAAARLLHRLLDRPPGRRRDPEHRAEGDAIIALALHDLERALAGEPACTAEVRARLAEASARFDAIYREHIARADISPAARRALGRAAGRLGDRRPGVVPAAWTPGEAPFALSLADFDWIAIPPSKGFRPGSDEADLQAADENEKADENELGGEPVALAGFEITSYPVTWAQFAAFWRAGGYRAPGDRRPPPWWRRVSDEAVDWWHSEPQLRPGLLDDPAYADWTLPNHPVIGVSWFEAMAFCAWLTERGRAAGELGDREAILLPSEIQWERAARGPDARRWPWGEHWRPGAANTREAGLESTTAVGLFPVIPDQGLSAEDAEACPLDMAGNVYEWTLTRWGPSSDKPAFGWPLVPGDGRDDPGGTDLRVVRGGSWWATPRSCRGAFRFWVVPLYWGGDQGFRVVRVSLASGSVS